MIREKELVNPMWQKRKYKNEKVNVAGRWFDSKAEASLFNRLSLEERGGRIRNLKCQPGTIFLGPSRTQFRPDFSFENEKGETEWAEFKGFKTPAWRIKLKLWRAVGPGKLHVYEGNASHMKLVETVIPKSDVCPLCGRLND